MKILADTADMEPVDADLREAAVLYDELMAGNISQSNVNSSDVLKRIVARIQDTKDSLGDLRTAQLWLQYMDMIDIMRQCIRSEHTGDWHTMKEFTSVSFNTNDQHRDMSSARQKRNLRDTQQIQTFLISKSPFSHDTYLRSIDSGVCAADDVNADRALSVGQTILDGMLGRKVWTMCSGNKSRSLPWRIN